MENVVPTVVASGHGPLLEGNVLGQHDPLKKRVLQTVALVNVFFGGQKKIEKKKHVGKNNMFQHWKFEIEIYIYI